jgi:hypothetical protein
MEEERRAACETHERTRKKEEKRKEKRLPTEWHGMARKKREELPANKRE